VGMGLAQFLCHRLASSLLFPILTYGCEVFTPSTHALQTMSSFWHKVQRWTMKCFRYTPKDMLAIEACLPPLDLLLRYKKRLAALRVLCSPPEINQAAARLPPSVQTPFLHCNPQDHRRLLARNAGSLFPIKWVQPRLPSKNSNSLLMGEHNRKHHAKSVPAQANAIAAT